jgi:hypothetical protein
MEMDGKTIDELLRTLDAELEKGTLYPVQVAS